MSRPAAARTASLAALCFVLGAPLVARADDTKLPFNPFEKSQKGDWCVLVGTFKRDGTGEKKGPCASYARVAKVEGDKVTLAEADQNGGVIRTERTFSTKEAPTLEATFALEGGKVSDVKWSDEERTLEDKKVACKKVTFTWKHDGSTDEITAVFAPQVKAGGQVAVAYRGHLKSGEDEIETVMKLEVAGYGTGDAKDYGETPDGLLDFEMLSSSGSETELPLNPFAKAKTGDWTAYRVEVESPRKTETGVMGYEVTGVAKGMVRVEHTFRMGEHHEPERTFELSKKEPPKAAEFIRKIFKERDAEALVVGMKSSDAKRSVGDREFDCKKVTFQMRDDKARLKVKLWLSDQVKAPGIVALEVSFQERTESGSLTVELAGFGDDEKTEWGKTLEQIAKKKKKKKSDDDE